MRDDVDERGLAAFDDGNRALQRRREIRRVFDRAFSVDAEPLRDLGIVDVRIGEAVRRAGGVWIPGNFGMMPPTIGGEALGDRFDVVLTLTGLANFATERAGARIVRVDDLDLPVLPLSRVLHSKRAAARPKDMAVLPALEAALAAQQDEEG